LHVDTAGPGKVLGLGDGAQEARPADGVIDAFVHVAVRFMRRDHRPVGAREDFR
jgi:hypothetical protein